MKSAIPLLIVLLSLTIITIQFAPTVDAAPLSQDYQDTLTPFEKWLQLTGGPGGPGPINLAMAANDDYDQLESDIDDVIGQQQQDYFTQDAAKSVLTSSYHYPHSNFPQPRQRVGDDLIADVMKRAKADWLKAWSGSAAKRASKGGGLPDCMRICLAQRYLHPSQCHLLC